MSRRSNIIVSTILWPFVIAYGLMLLIGLHVLFDSFMNRVFDLINGRW